MRRSFLIFMACLLLLGACGAPGGPSPSITRLPGADHDAATAAIPLKEFVPRPQDYSEGHPDLPGLRLSHNTLMLVLTLPTTVGQANSILADLDGEIVGGLPGTAGTSRGILFLRVPTQTHGEMETLLQDLRARSAVHEAVQDGLLTGDVLPRESSDPLWVWDPNSMQATWNHSLIRTPQSWNLNTALEASIHKGERIPTPIAVLDGGFAGSHEDLSYTNLTPGLKRSHGTHVAGIIAAKFMNGTGMEGVNPFTDLIVKGHDFGLKGADPDAFNVSFAHALVWSIHDVILSNPGIRVINVSMGYGWYKDGIDADTDVPAQELAGRHGNLFYVMQSLVPALPVVVVSAGNDGGKNARYNSPMANAALRGITKNVIVVEGVRSVLDSNGKVIGAERYPSSNINGHIAAPGAEIYSTYLPDGYCATSYCFVSGTSQAAPHVAGVIGYLYVVDPALDPPTLTSNPILDDLLLPDATPAGGGASNVIDAFAAVMNIDRIRGNRQVLRMLLDIDDGTPDGNQRTDPESGADHTANAYGGDARIDMKDFRRWRDWLLQSEVEQGLHGGAIDLDGSPGHVKKDLNLDGDVHPHTSATAPEESVYPRGDFNGDGIISRSACALVPNVLTPAESSCPPGQVSDLDMLVMLFDDPHYQRADLEGLVESLDVEVWPRSFLGEGTVSRVRSLIGLPGLAGPALEREHVGSARGAGARQVYTLPKDVYEDGFVVRVEGYDAGGTLVLEAEEEFTAAAGFTFRLGADHFVDPSGACVVPTSTARLSAAGARADACVDAAPRVHLISSDVWLQVWANACGDVDQTTVNVADVTSFTHSVNASASGTCSNVAGSAQATASGSFAVHLEPDIGVAGLTAETQAQHSNSPTMPGASSRVEWHVVFEVLDANVLVKLDATYLEEPADSHIRAGVNIMNLDTWKEVVVAHTLSPTFSAERVLPPARYRMISRSETSRIISSSNTSQVSQTFEIRFESVDD